MAEKRLSHLPAGTTIVTQLKMLAYENPNKTAFVFYDKDMTRTAMTRGEVWDKSTRFAAVLHRMGIGKGDIVCNTLVNSRERLISTYGVILTGAASMHGQILSTDGEDIIKGWKESRCKAIILKAHEKGGANAILESLKDKEHTADCDRYKGLSNLSHIIRVTIDDNKHVNNGCWLESLRNETESYVDENITEDDLALILTTSGSTGFSKLVPHTHRSILFIAVSYCNVIAVRTDTVFFNAQSFGWVAGLPICYLVSGIVRVAFNLNFGPLEDPGVKMLQIFEAEKCDIGVIFSVNIQSVLNALDAGMKITNYLRVVATGGSPISSTTMRAIGRFTESVTTIYGASEFGLVCATTVKDPNAYENCCVGCVADNSMVVKIIGDDMKELPTGQIGEIYMRSPSVTKGYLNQERNRKIFRDDGWHCTSDIGLINDKRELFVFCRKANAISHKGFVHYPGWIESLINKHPGIQKSIVIGIPDHVNCEDICLCVTKSPQADDLTKQKLEEFCESLFIGYDQSMKPVPKYYLFFESFPLSINGKFDRKATKAEVFKRMGITAA